MRLRPESRLATALQKTGDGAFVTQTDGRIVLWNRAAERTLGFTAREAVTRGCCGVFGGVDAAGARLCYPGCRNRTRVRLTEPVASYDMLTRTKTGSPVWLNVSTLPLGSTRAPVMLHLFRDVTAARAFVKPAAGAKRAGATGLTRRELEIVRLLTQGLSTAAIAARLEVSRATVRNHVQNLFAKLGVHSRLAAVAYANAHRLF
jgi:PAS domain S-box-containing protein